MQSSSLYASICRSSASSCVCIHCSNAMIDAPPSLISAPPLEVEEGLHLLEPVAAARSAEPVAHDLEQVDEDLAAEEVVELGLARAVAPHEPAKRGDLVGRVVVDVQVGVAASRACTRSMNCLERGALGRRGRARAAA